VPEVSFSGGGARLDALFSRPPGARLLYVLAHGAGAGMRHPFLAAIAEALAEESVATFRYDWPISRYCGPRWIGCRAHICASSWEPITPSTS